MTEESTVAVTSVDTRAVTDENNSLLRFALTTAVVWQSTNTCFEIIGHVYTNAHRLVESAKSLGTAEKEGEVEVKQAMGFIDEVEKHVQKLENVRERVKASGNSAVEELTNDTSQFFENLGFSALNTSNKNKSKILDQIAEIEADLFKIYDEYFTQLGTVEAAESEIKYDELIIQQIDDELEQIDNTIKIIQTQKALVGSTTQKEIEELQKQAQIQQTKLHEQITTNIKKLQTKKDELENLKKQAAMEQQYVDIFEDVNDIFEDVDDTFDGIY